MRTFVWATGTTGDFLKDGYYPVRQAFLRRLIGHGEIDFSREKIDFSAVPDERVQSERTLFSVPFKGEDGSVLGTL